MTRLDTDHPAIRAALATSASPELAHTMPQVKSPSKHRQRRKMAENAPSDETPFLRPLIVIVPYLPPTLNHMYNANRNGSKRLSDEALKFRAAISKEVADVCAAEPWEYIPGVPLSLTVFLTFGTRARQDADNRVKAGLDALALALGFDDRHVTAIHVYTLGVDPRRPLCELHLGDARRDAAYQHAAAAALGVEYDGA